MNTAKQIMTLIFTKKKTNKPEFFFLKMVYFKSESKNLQLFFSQVVIIKYIFTYFYTK